MNYFVCRDIKQRYNTFHLTTIGAESLSLIACVDICLPGDNVNSDEKKFPSPADLNNILQKNLLSIQTSTIATNVQQSSYLPIKGKLINFSIKIYLKLFNITPSIFVKMI